MVVEAARRNLDHTEVARAVQWVQDGARLGVVFLMLDVYTGVINRLCSRCQNIVQYTRRQYQGHLEVITPVQDCYNVTLSLGNRTKTALSMETDFYRDTGVDLSNQALVS